MSASIDILVFGPFTLVPGKRLLLRNGDRVPLGSRAFEILTALTERAGEVVGARELMQRAWPHATVEDANLRVQIASLRKFLGDSAEGAKFIAAVSGRGYVFVAPIQRLDRQTRFAPPADLAKLPQLPATVFGRHETVDALCLQVLSRRFVTIVGPGGVGKTTVAVATAQALASDFAAPSIAFADLGAVGEPTLAVGVVLAAAGCAVRGPDPLATLAQHLADRHMLLILDSCEHVIEAMAPLVATLLKGAPNVHIVATSREALRIQEETVHSLLPLGCPAFGTPTASQALAAPAVQLFMDRAISSGHSGPLRDSEAPVVAAICRRLDGIALAIEIAASRAGTYGFDTLAEMLDGGGELFLQGDRIGQMRHQTLQATLDWSYARLSPFEQDVFRKLSVFAGPFSMAAASAVTGETGLGTASVGAAVAGLIDKSLVAVAPKSGPACFRLLDTTRAYAELRLAEASEASKLAQRHAVYFADLLRTGNGSGPDIVTGAVSQLVPHLGNIRKALSWSFSVSGDRRTGTDLASSAGPLFLGLSLLDDCRHWCRLGLNALDDDCRGSMLELSLQETLATALMYGSGNGEEVRRTYERALEIATAHADTGRHLQLLTGYYTFHSRRADFHGSLAAARRRRRITRGMDDLAQKALTEWLLAVSLHLIGRQSAARRHCEIAFSNAAGLSAERLNIFGHSLHVSGYTTYSRALWLSGMPDRALAIAEQGLQKARLYDHPVTHCIALSYLTPVFFWLGDLARAGAMADELLSRARTHALAPYHAVGLAMKGEWLLLEGDAQAAAGMLGEAVHAAEVNQYYTAIFGTMRAQAEALAGCGRPIEALAVIDDAMARARRAGGTMWLSDIQRARGEILLQQPNPDIGSAKEMLESALAEAKLRSSPGWELRAALPLARLVAEEDKARARSLLASVYEQFKEGWDTPDLLASRRLIVRLGTR
ncbi:Predicted ATPase [Kaistia soli DSM 19436]|uniref:Predicted ATPase n=1 Tax=Kaistia soli DSM 19436 TaxID=1122133 RepID=A0A1M5L684_9HYPH|nr:winged helix-turn-helix domain-containing protein [Kaistia soli]SHG60527.1 Predicted ATPase [Kaistia soli DSM 19436]